MRDWGEGGKERGVRGVDGEILIQAAISQWKAQVGENVERKEKERRRTEGEGIHPHYLRLKHRQAVLRGRVEGAKGREGWREGRKEGDYVKACNPQ